MSTYETFLRNIGFWDGEVGNSSPFIFLYKDVMTRLDLYDKLYNAFCFPLYGLKTSIHPSLFSLSNLFTSHDRILSNSKNLSLEK